ncbi:MAG: PaaI family thioesterase [Spirochaetota bacterium]
MTPEVQRNEYCFCCGADNERGLHLAFAYPEEGRAETSLFIPEWFAGWKGITHGGLLSTLLDEAMAHACMHAAEGAVTAEMTVRFKKPLPTSGRALVRGRLVETRGRVMSTQGQILDEAGTIYAEATAKFIVTTKRP